MLSLLFRHFLFKISEISEGREILSKKEILRQYYKKEFSIREKLLQAKVTEIAIHASKHVPYYIDLFYKLKLNPVEIRDDFNLFYEIPFLTKEIIKNESDRLISTHKNNSRLYNMKTGGSTGESVHIFYDQNSIDYSSAVTLFCRESVGDHLGKKEVHFACDFPGHIRSTKLTREDFKSLILNRSNIFFSDFGSDSLEKILFKLKKEKPFLVHCHPSTMFALANHVIKNYGNLNLFSIFESSGEMLTNKQKDTIISAFDCKVVNRYGLAEFGVIAYQLSGKDTINILDSEGLPETYVDVSEGLIVKELVFTGVRNFHMPLLRYRTGDLADINRTDDGYCISSLTGRIHDLVKIGNLDYPTHHIMDVLDHQIRGIREFQIDITHGGPPVIRVIPASEDVKERISFMFNQIWGDKVLLIFCQSDDFIRIGHNQKFRHLVH